jgi:hypothetical protein
MMPTAVPIVKTEKGKRQLTKLYKIIDKNIIERCRIGGSKARSSNQGAPIEKEKLRNNKAQFKSNVEFSSNDPNTKDDGIYTVYSSCHTHHISINVLLLHCMLFMMAPDCTSLDTEYSAGKKRKSESVKGVLSEKINKRR